MGYLYKIEFDNGKSYIGITKGHYMVRMQKHESRAHRALHEGAISNAMRKYPSAYKIVPLLRSDDLAYLQLMEQKAIAAFGTKAPNGYNLTGGGEGLFEASAETREKIGAAHKGKILSAETRAKISAGHTGLRPWNVGVSHSVQTRAKISAAKKGKTLSAEHKAKISVSLKGNTRAIGHVHSDETRAKISATHKGKPHSAEHNAKVSAAHKRRQKGWGK